jgi:hypothetical protein
MLLSGILGSLVFLRLRQASQNHATVTSMLCQWLATGSPVHTARCLVFIIWQASPDENGVFWLIACMDRDAGKRKYVTNIPLSGRTSSVKSILIIMAENNFQCSKKIGTESRSGLQDSFPQCCFISNHSGINFFVSNIFRGLFQISHPIVHKPIVLTSISVVPFRIYRG